MSIFSTLILGMACGDKSSTTDTATNQITDTGTTEEIDICAPLEDSSKLGMTGSIVFADGTPPQGNVRVQMCYKETCFVAKWHDEGFCFPEGTLPNGEVYAFDVVPLGDLSGKYTNPLTILEPTENIVLDTPVLISQFTETVDDSSAELNLNGELIIQLNDNYPLSFEENEQVSLSASKVNLETDGLPLEGFDTSKIVGAWYLGPFDTQPDMPLTFELNNPSILADTTYDIYNGNYEDKEWTLTATITSSEEQRLLVEGGLQILSTLLIVQQ